MGETAVKMKVQSLVNGNSAEVEAMVDMGATYSVVPESILKSLQVKTVDTITIELADGRTIRRDMGSVMVELEGKLRPTPVLFGKEGDAALIGLVTLESCGPAVDPVHKKLIPLPKTHHY